MTDNERKKKLEQTQENVKADPEFENRLLNLKMTDFLLPIEKSEEKALKELAGKIVDLCCEYDDERFSVVSTALTTALLSICYSLKDHITINDTEDSEIVEQTEKKKEKKKIREDLH